MNEELMPVKDAAQYLKLNYMTVYKLAQKRKVPASKVGGTWRFRKDILDRWLEEQAMIYRRPVLVVDDDVRIRDIIQEVVSDKGYEVVAVGTGEEAVNEIDKRDFSLIFLDLRLPGLSGVDVFRRAKEKDEEAVVVVITGYGDEPIAEEALSMGPVFLIRKPFIPSDIGHIVDIVMKARA